MISAKSHSKNIFKHSYINELRQNLPFAIAYAILCTFSIIVPVLIQLINNVTYATTYEINEKINFVFALSPVSVLVLPLFAGLLGIMQFAYLTNKRAMDVYASLPIKRETTFKSKILASITILFTPIIISNIAIFLLNLIFVGFNGFLLLELAFIIFESMVLVLIPYCMVVFVSTLSGTITENVIYSVIFVIAPMVIYGIMSLVLEKTIYGFVSSPQTDLVMGFLCPYISFLTGNYEWVIFNGITDNIIDNPFGFFDVAGEYLLQGFVWVIISIVLLILAQNFFKRRKSEKAGVKNASNVLNSIALYITVLVGSIAIFYFVSSIYNYSYYYYEINTIGVVLMLLVSILIFISFQLVVLQSVKAMIKSYKKFLPIIPILALILVFSKTDGFGTFAVVPNVDEVESVSIIYNIDQNSYYYDYDTYNFSAEDEQTIQFVLDGNELVLQTKKESVDYYNSIRIKYKLKNGFIIERNYNYISQEADEYFMQLSVNQKYIEKTNTLFFLPYDKYQTISVMDIYGTNISDSAFQESIDVEILSENIKIDYIENLDKQKKGEVALGYILFSTLMEEEYSSMQAVERDGKDLSYYYPNLYYISIMPYYTNTINYLKSIDAYEYFEPKYENIENVRVVEKSGDSEWSSLAYLYYKDRHNYLVNSEKFALKDYYGYEYYTYYDAGNVAMYYNTDEIKEILSNVVSSTNSDNVKNLVIVEINDRFAEFLLTK